MADTATPEEGARQPPDELPAAVAERQRKREKIRAYLRGNHPRYLSWYEGALYSHEDLRNPDRIRQSAHSLRDLSNRIVKDLLPGAQVKDAKRAKSKGKSKKNAFASEIEQALAKAGGDIEVNPSVQPHLQAIASQWVKVHNSIVSIAHSGTSDPLELTRLLEEFEDIVWAAFQATPERVQEIDVFLTVAVPDAKTLKAALRLLTRPAAKDYFFDRLQHPGWLAPLVKEGGFSKAPGAIRRGESIQFPSWSALVYLKRVAHLHPAVVVKIVQSLPDLDNPYVMGQFIEILKSLSPDASTKALPVVDKWLRQRHQLFAHHKATDLFDHYVTNKTWRSAQVLARGLVAVSQEPPPAGQHYLESKGYASDYEVEDFLEKHLPPLVKAIPYDVARLLEVALVDAISWEVKHSKKRGGRRMGSYWRSTIEDSKQNYRHGSLKNALVTALREALTAAAEQKHKNFQELIKRFLGHKDWVFRRLAIDAIRRGRVTYPALAEGVRKAIPFAPKAVLGEVFHEYHLFISESLGDITPEEREKYLDRLAKKLDYKWDGTRTGYDTAHTFHRFLQGVSKHLLAGSKYAELLAKQNAVSGPGGMDPSLLIEMSSGWVVSESPLTADEIGKLSVPELVDYLKKFVDDKSPRESRAAGLAMALGEAVKADPNKYVGELGLFEDMAIKPVYLTHLIRGFENALQAKNTFEWAPVLRLCKTLADRDSAKELPPEVDPEDVYEGFFGACANLFQTGFDVDAGRLIIPEAEAARDILLRILAHPMGPGEKRYADGDHDATSASRNTFHGQSIHALMRYLTFRWHLLSPGKFMKREPGLANLLTPEIRASIETMLNSPEVTPAVHAALGWFFPVLVSIAPEWVGGIREKIFDQTRLKLWKAAWDGYISFNTVYGDLIKPLRTHYAKAIEVIPERAENNREDRESLNRLAEHLLLAKIHSFDCGEGPDLLDAFYGKAGLKLREHAAWYMIRCLDEDIAKPRAWRALKPVIEARLTWAESAKSPDLVGSEIVALASSLKRVPATLAELEPLLRRMFPFFSGNRYAEDVVQFLCEKAGTDLLLALDLLSALFATRLGHFEMWTAEEGLIKLLEESKRTGDATVREKVRVIATRFFDSGRLNYRDLMV